MTAIEEQPLHPEITAWREQGGRLHWLQGDCSIFYRDIGDPTAAPDRTLMLLHGFPESSFSFHKVIDRLSQQLEGTGSRFSETVCSVP